MKKIHALTIVDKSSSMTPHRSRTIEGINSNIQALKAEVDADTEILNTQLQFSSNKNGNWYAKGDPKDVVFNETDFVFKRVGERVNDLPDMVDTDFVPNGWTPLLDAIGYGIEKVKDFHKNDLGSEDLKIIVTIYTDGGENSSEKYDNKEIKKMIEHFQSDGKWTFTFVGCGGIDEVSQVSSGLGISANNTMAYDASAEGYTKGLVGISTSYSNFARAAKLGVVDDSLFTAKAGK